MIPPIEERQRLIDAAGLDRSLAELEAKSVAPELKALVRYSNAIIHAKLADRNVRLAAAAKEVADSRLKIVEAEVETILRKTT